MDLFSALEPEAPPHTEPEPPSPAPLYEQAAQGEVGALKLLLAEHEEVWKAEISRYRGARTPDELERLVSLALRRAAYDVTRRPQGFPDFGSYARACIRAAFLHGAPGYP